MSVFHWPAVDPFPYWTMERHAIPSLSVRSLVSSSVTRGVIAAPCTLSSGFRHSSRLSAMDEKKLNVDRGAAPWRNVGAGDRLQAPVEEGSLLHAAGFLC